jgi:hypothetical protein
MYCDSSSTFSFKTKYRFRIYQFGWQDLSFIKRLCAGQYLKIFVLHHTGYLPGEDWRTFWTGGCK